MTNALYTKAKKKLLDADIDMLVDTINASLVDTGLYSPAIATHEFRSDIANDAVIATQALGGKSTTDGVFDATDVVFPNVPASANTIEVIVIWKDTGSQGTSPLIALIDNATGLPITPNDGNITIIWDDGASKIFRLV